MTKMRRVLGGSIKKCNSFLKYAVLAFAFVFVFFFLVTIKQIYKQKKMDHKKSLLKAMSAEG